MQLSSAGLGNLDSPKYCIKKWQQSRTERVRSSSRTLGRVMQQLQRFRRKESSAFFFQEHVHFHYSTTVSARRHKVNSKQLFAKVREKVAGSTHAECTDSP